MVIALDIKELGKYPFLKESEQLVRKQFDSLDRFLAGPRGSEALNRAQERVLDALAGKKEFRDDEAHQAPPEIEIASYALARMLVSCIGDRILTDRLTRFEARRASVLSRTRGTRKEAVCRTERRDRHESGDAAGL